MKYEFIVDEKNKSFTFAGQKFDKYHMLRSAAEGCYRMLGNSIPHKNNYDKFIEEFDIPAKTFIKIHNAIMTRFWIDPIREYSKYLAFRGASKKPIVRELERVHELLPVLKQADDDGIRNVIPILFLYGKEPKDVKGIVGKSTWKSLCKNSFTRNLHLMKSGRYYNIAHPNREVFENDTSLQVMNLFPSGVLKRGGNAPVSLTEEGLWAYKNKNCVDLKRHSLRRAENIYRDTKSMSVKVGRSFNSKWTYTKMYEKHEEFTRLINLRKFSPKPFEVLKGKSWKEYTSGEYKATLLQSPLDVKTEGEVMSHCVGSYADHVAAGKYLVYSITKYDKRSSTLGVNICTINTDVSDRDINTPTGTVKTIKTTAYTYSQHYKHCNQRVDCIEEQQLAADIIKDLNNGDQCV